MPLAINALCLCWPYYGWRLCRLVVSLAVGYFGLLVGHASVWVHRQCVTGLCIITRNTLRAWDHATHDIGSTAFRLGCSRSRLDFSDLSIDRPPDSLSVVARLAFKLEMVVQRYFRTSQGLPSESFMAFVCHSPFPHIHLALALRRFRFHPQSSPTFRHRLRVVKSEVRYREEAIAEHRSGCGCAGGAGVLGGGDCEPPIKIGEKWNS